MNNRMAATELRVETLMTFPFLEHLSGETSAEKVTSVFISEAVETPPTFYREYFAALMPFPSRPSF